MPGGFDPPASVLKSWPKPNYVDPHTRGWGLTAAIILLGIISVAAVAARLWARIVRSRNVGIDDWIFLAAVIPALGLTVNTFLATHIFYCDRHIWDVPITAIPVISKVNFVQQILYIVSSGLIKISVLLFYRRITISAVTKIWKYILWTAIVSVSAFFLACLILTFTMCQPVSAIWNRADRVWVADHEYHCYSYGDGSSFLGANIISTLLDVVAALVPIAICWKLHIPRRQRVALAIIFLLGVFICTVGVIRLFYGYRFFYGSYDTTWTAGLLLTWTAVEILMGTICASLPALKVYFNDYFRNAGATPTMNFVYGNQVDSRTNSGVRQRPCGSLFSRSFEMSDSKSGSDTETFQLEKKIATLEASIGAPHDTVYESVFQSRAERGSVVACTILAATAAQGLETDYQ